MSYVYHQMASYFNRDNVALPGFASFFRESSLDERSHAQALMDFQVHLPTAQCACLYCVLMAARLYNAVSLVIGYHSLAFLSFVAACTCLHCCSFDTWCHSACRPQGEGV